MSSPGIVSRVDFQLYTHHRSISIGDPDQRADHPGNSVSGNARRQSVGVAFQG